MCGILGIISFENNLNDVQLPLEILTHRGPDYAGIFRGEFCLLGHNRLAIIDLTREANQPMKSFDNKQIIVFNGEIYNYKELRNELATAYPFRTQSDTEVLLAAYRKWGKNMLSRLNGMFAFAIWDQEKKLLFAARDRFGVKPFYYSVRQGNFYFGSEIKGLWSLNIPKKPSEYTWANYYTYGSYGMPDETFWQEIHQLPGSYALEYSQQGLKTYRWYDFIEETGKIPSNLSFEEAKNRYEEILLESIKLRFRADVPVGFNISGGLDSSTLLAYVYNLFGQDKKIQAYTFITGDVRYDELPWVKEMIKYTGYPLQVVQLSPEEAPQKITEMALIQDEPYGGLPTVAYGNLFERARQNGYLVLLDGQGMDEQWAGYDYYIKKSNHTIQGVNTSPFRANVLSDELKSIAKKPKYPRLFEDNLKNLQYRDLFYTKIPRALRFNDRASMKASVELREPFLDFRLVEFAFAQPKQFKIQNNSGKFLLRQLTSKYLPKNISFAPKRPLQTPQREWLGDNLSNWVEQQINFLIEHPATKYWFNSKELIKEWKTYKNGKQDSSFHIWQWINTAILLKDI